jgi:hypothetical protein
MCYLEVYEQICSYNHKAINTQHTGTIHRKGASMCMCIHTHTHTHTHTHAHAHSNSRYLKHILNTEHGYEGMTDAMKGIKLEEREK